MFARFSQRRLQLPVAIVAFIATLSVMELFSYQYRELHLTQQRNHVLAKASLLRSQIEYEIHTTLNLTMGLALFVSNSPEFSAEEFNRVAAILHLPRPEPGRCSAQQTAPVPAVS